MKIILISYTSIPVYAYGGTERVIWDLGYALSQLGHQVTYLVAAGSTCPFAEVLYIDPSVDLRMQIPDGIDIVHFQFSPDFSLDEDFNKPYVVTEHGNTAADNLLPFNSIFVSKNHAQRHGSDQFVYNGLNWDAYGAVDFDARREHHHFLGKAAWRVKNVTGAIDVALDAGVELAVMGGTRLNLKRGFRFTWSRRIQFHGMVGGQDKFRLLNTSNGLIFPVRWHEPFGLAVIESLYFGCPVFATPYGALPELVGPEHGFLSANKAELVSSIQEQSFDMRACHQQAVAHFNAETMARGYLEKYEQVLAGERLSKNHPRATGRDVRLPWN
ncbi:MAG: glycosyltransferase [Polaromonas sp.]|nr:glycosyltransferase [Polaromonas sp.]